MGDSVQANELENRLIDFAVRVISVADALPDTPTGKHISRQLLRSGTSPAPNYAEARGAESCILIGRFMKLPRPQSQSLLSLASSMQNWHTLPN